MSLLTVGRLVVKIAGRDAGRTGVIVSILDEKHVLIDGGTRRKKANVNHLELLAQTIELKDNATRDEVKKTFEQLQLPVWETKKKPATVRPRLVRKGRMKTAEVAPQPEEEPAKEQKPKRAVKKKGE